MTREEAIEVYNGLINQKIKEAFEFFAPELRGSEDERIRKEIVSIVQSYRDSCISEGTHRFDDCLAWLEKQKHTAPNEYDEKMRKKIIDHLESIKMGCVICTIDTSKEIAWLEKQKENRMQPVYDNQDSFESALEKAWKDYNDSGARTVDGCEDDYIECAHAKGFREGYLFGLEKQKGLDEMIVVSPEVWDNAITDAYENGKRDSEKQKEQKPASYSPLCNTIKDKIREYVANNFVTDTVVKTDVKSIVKAMEEGVRLGKEEQKSAEDKELLKNILFQKKGITYDDYKCKNDPYVGLSFYELIKCLEEYDKARSNR